MQAHAAYPPPAYAQPAQQQPQQVVYVLMPVPAQAAQLGAGQPGSGQAMARLAPASATPGSSPVFQPAAGRQWGALEQLAAGNTFFAVPPAGYAAPAQPQSCATLPQPAGSSSAMTAYFTALGLQFPLYRLM